MPKINLLPQLFWRLITFLIILVGIFSQPTAANAHPLGNFTINHFARLHLDHDQVTVQYVVDLAEIPAFQALQVADLDGDRTPSNPELQAYLTQTTPSYVTGLALQIDAQTVPLVVNAKTISLPPGAGGLATLRLEWSLTGTLPIAKTVVRTLDFADHNDRTRIGWREIVIDPTSSWQIFNSSAYSNSLTDALRAYPEDLLTTPLQEAVAHLSFTRSVLPPKATPLLTREGRSLPHRRTVSTTLAEWKAWLFNYTFPNNYQRLPLMPPLDHTTTGGMALAIAAALIWGAMHAMTPGHGKTLVGAYLVGTKATPKHALLLALTTTITHTIGVFVLGLITLFAAEYVLPEQLYPWLSLGSGLMVVAIGGNLFAQRWPHFRLNFSAIQTAQPSKNVLVPHHHSHHPNHYQHSHDHSRFHNHEAMPSLSVAIAAPPPLQGDIATAQPHSRQSLMPTVTVHPGRPDHLHTHNHGHEHEPGHEHSSHTHLPGADGSPVTWQSLLALGISGGLMPCPAALVLLLGTIALGQVGFGLILVFVFSLGLAGVLTGLGLLLVYAKHLFKAVPVALRWVQYVPVLGALGITIAGLGIAIRALFTISGGS